NGVWFFLVCGHLSLAAYPAYIRIFYYTPFFGDSSPTLIEDVRALQYETRSCHRQFAFGVEMACIVAATAKNKNRTAAKATPRNESSGDRPGTKLASILPA